MSDLPSPPLGALLLRYRQRAGLPQEELAALAGVSVDTISNLERSVSHRPRVATLQLLADALQLTPTERETLLAAARRHPTPPPALPNSSPPGVAVAATSLAPLVGRQRELEHLERFLNGEVPPVLGLAGEPGIGKSRLLREAAARAAALGWTAIEGACQRRGLEAPFAPLAEPLTRLLASQTPARQQALLHGCEWLVPLLPELAETGIAPLPQGNPAPERARWLMFSAVGRLLTNLAGPMGTLLLLDDVQWASEDVNALLAVLAHAATISQLRVLLAYRDSEVQPGDPRAELLADLAREDRVAQITLGPLALREARELLRHVLEAEATTLSATQIERLVQRTEGVPFYLVSCAQSLRTADADDPGDRGTAPPDVPWKLAQTIRQRAAALPPIARAVLNTAAVVGRAVPGALLAQIVQQPEDALVEGLEAVCQARLLTELEADTDTYQFTHDLIREVITGDLSTRRRKLLHQHVAEVLENLVASHTQRRPAEIAYHFAQSDQPQRALGYLVEAAEQARGSGAHREQVALLSQAIPLAEQAQDHHKVTELLARRGRAWHILARWREAADDYVLALDGLGGLEQRARRAEVLIWLAEARHWLLDVPATRR
jgi:predicted ATPase/DNA-binding XRE family transcriptional regulator